MSLHLQRDMERMHREIFSMSSIVEEMIDKATLALCERNDRFAAEVIESDSQVDQREVLIEEECLKLLALHQPVAVDLRRIASVLKINNDLERIADLAVNIAQRASHINRFAEFPIPDDVPVMARMARRMVQGALDAFVHLDARGARSVIRTDRDVDALNVEIIEHLTQRMRQSPSLVAPALHCFSAVRHIERIGDHATNICEDVIYLVEGDIVRHQQFLEPRVSGASHEQTQDPHH
ncbi:MAG: phosphate signaling complex protein PhoU [Planctomycetes bacterium]|nr:phosphate signaling complex protein PhoU [Planctomycetota bacterium]